MGVMNLLKADWKGKVGQTVGAKWKNLSTIRTYTKPSNPDTAAQQVTRSGFKEVSSFAALFSDQIKQLSALDTRGMSVRNAIISANSEMVKNGALNQCRPKGQQGRSSGCFWIWSNYSRWTRFSDRHLDKSREPLNFC